MKKIDLIKVALITSVVFSNAVFAGSSCKDLPNASELKTALTAAKNDPAGNGGVHAPEWLTLVDTSGNICAVVHSEAADADTTTLLAPIHRIYAAQKASTANGFSRAGIAVSTAQLWYGSQKSEISSGVDAGINTSLNPYTGDPKTWGTLKDLLIGKRIGSTNTMPGGLPLYDKTKTKVGAIGVSGDFRCTDHVIAWKVRENLRNGAYTVANNAFGLSAAHNDAMIQDIDANGISKSGFGFYKCEAPTVIPTGLNPTNENDGGSIEGN